MEPNHRSRGEGKTGPKSQKSNSQEGPRKADKQHRPKSGERHKKAEALIINKMKKKRDDLLEAAISRPTKRPRDDIIITDLDRVVNHNHGVNKIKRQEFGPDAKAYATKSARNESALSEANIARDKLEAMYETAGKEKKHFIKALLFTLDHEKNVKYVLTLMPFVDSISNKKASYSLLRGHSMAYAKGGLIVGIDTRNAGKTRLGLSRYNHELGVLRVQLKHVERIAGTCATQGSYEDPEVFLRKNADNEKPTKQVRETAVAIKEVLIAEIKSVDRKKSELIGDNKERPIVAPHVHRRQTDQIADEIMESAAAAKIVAAGGHLSDRLRQKRLAAAKRAEKLENPQVDHKAAAREAAKKKRSEKRNPKKSEKAAKTQAEAKQAAERSAAEAKAAAKSQLNGLHGEWGEKDFVIPAWMRPGPKLCSRILYAAGGACIGVYIGDKVFPAAPPPPPVVPVGEKLARWFETTRRAHSVRCEHYGNFLGSFDVYPLWPTQWQDGECVEEVVEFASACWNAWLAPVGKKLFEVESSLNGWNGSARGKDFVHGATKTEPATAARPAGGHVVDKRPPAATAPVSGAPPKQRKGWDKERIAPTGDAGKDDRLNRELKLVRSGSLVGNTTQQAIEQTVTPAEKDAEKMREKAEKEDKAADDARKARQQADNPLHDKHTTYNSVPMRRTFRYTLITRSGDMMDILDPNIMPPEVAHKYTNGDLTGIQHPNLWKNWVLRRSAQYAVATAGIYAICTAKGWSKIYGAVAATAGVVGIQVLKQAWYMLVDPDLPTDAGTDRRTLRQRLSFDAGCTIWCLTASPTEYAPVTTIDERKPSHTREKALATESFYDCVLEKVVLSPLRWGREAKAVVVRPKTMVDWRRVEQAYRQGRIMLESITNSVETYNKVTTVHVSQERPHEGKQAVFIFQARSGHAACEALRTGWTGN